MQKMDVVSTQDGNQVAFLIGDVVLRNVGACSRIKEFTDKENAAVYQLRMMLDTL